MRPGDNQGRKTDRILDALGTIPRSCIGSIRALVAGDTLASHSPFPYQGRVQARCVTLGNGLPHTAPSGPRYPQRRPGTEVRSTSETCGFRLCFTLPARSERMKIAAAFSAPRKTSALALRTSATSRQ